MFHVGQKVVCVDDVPQQGKVWTEAPVVLGRVYQISRANFIDNDGDECVRLVGMRQYPSLPYLASRFRPAVERKTDISIFTEMLNPQPVKVLKRITAGQSPQQEG